MISWRRTSYPVYCEDSLNFYPLVRRGGGGYCHIWAIQVCAAFQAVYSRIGYINQSVWVLNRVSFFRKLIIWLKILSRLGKQLLQDRGIWGVYSSIGQQNSAELALVQVKGSRIPAAHPHPEIPKVPLPPPGPLSSSLMKKKFQAVLSIDEFEMNESEMMPSDSNAFMFVFQTWILVQM